MSERAGSSSITVRLFDTDRTDRELSLDEAARFRVGDRQLLWIDSLGRPKSEHDRLLERYRDLTPRTRAALAGSPDVPQVVVHKSYVHARVAALGDDTASEEPLWLDILAGKNVVMTIHDEPLAILDGLDERIEADADLGRIDAAGFTSVLLDAVVTTYYGAVDEIEAVVDALDARSLQRDASADLLPELVTIRRRIARLRRALSIQRTVFAAFGEADVAIASDIGDFTTFPAVAERFERAIGAVDNTRDLLLGSFEVYMTRTAQRTNDIMKALTLVSVLILPGSLLAGLLGMNVPGPFDAQDRMAFWITGGLIVVLAIATVAVARLRRWI